MLATVAWGRVYGCLQRMSLLLHEIVADSMVSEPNRMRVSIRLARSHALRGNADSGQANTPNRVSIVGSWYAFPRGAWERGSYLY